MPKTSSEILVPSGTNEKELVFINKKGIRYLSFNEPIKPVDGLKEIRDVFGINEDGKPYDHNFEWTEVFNMWSKIMRGARPFREMETFGEGLAYEGNNSDSEVITRHSDGRVVLGVMTMRECLKPMKQGYIRVFTQLDPDELNAELTRIPEAVAELPGLSLRAKFIKDFGLGPLLKGGMSEEINLSPGGNFFYRKGKVATISDGRRVEYEVSVFRNAFRQAKSEFPGDINAALMMTKEILPGSGTLDSKDVGRQTISEKTKDGRVDTRHMLKDLDAYHKKHIIFSLALENLESNKLELSEVKKKFEQLESDPSNKNYADKILNLSESSAGTSDFRKYKVIYDNLPYTILRRRIMELEESIRLGEEEKAKLVKYPSLRKEFENRSTK